MPDLTGSRALVTGASSGIGLDMAKILAGWGCDLIVAARRGDRLDALATELASATNVTVETVAVDLSDPGGPQQLVQAADAVGDVDILINNAGFGSFQAFSTDSWDVHAQMLRLNVVALAELTHQFCTRMQRRDRPAYIMNVASVVAFFPIPHFANYCGTKAYVRNFSESLASELAGTNVRVSCLSPGATKTEFSDVSGQSITKAQSSAMMASHKVARVGLTAMLGGRRQVVTGIPNKLLTFLRRLVSRRIMAWGAGKVLGRPQPRAALPGGSK